MEALFFYTVFLSETHCFFVTLLLIKDKTNVLTLYIYNHESIS